MPWVGQTRWAWWPLSVAAAPGRGGQQSSGPQQPAPRPAISWEQLTLKNVFSVPSVYRKTRITFTLLTPTIHANPN